jgi:hypothetical protein
VGLEENLFPSQLSLNSRQDLEEERRLFYVAITRAMKKLTLSFASSRFKFGTISSSEPSRFLSELDPQYLQMDSIFTSKQATTTSTAGTGKTITGLVQEVYDIVGSFAVDRDDLHVTEAQKQSIIAACKSGAYSSFGTFNVHGVEDLDGWKFRLGGDNWVMIRPSGTEPVLRVYAQGAQLAQVREILDATKATILS